MKTTAAVLAFLAAGTSANAGLLISGVIDGPLSGGTPKAIELYATADIADLSIYGVGSANNGGGSDGEEFTLSGSALAGDYIWVASEDTQFTNFFGFAPTFTNSAASINGDDAIELFMNGSVIDLYGDIDVEGDPPVVWNYADSWAYRKNGTGPDTVFDSEDWTFAGTDALDGTSSASSADVPFGTYVVPEPASAALLGLGTLLIARRRRGQ